MYVPSFNGCWAKIERAKEHRDALENYVTETFSVESNRPRLGVKFDIKSGYHIVYVRVMPDLGSALQRSSIILGDIVHNLRSALDHLAYQLALKRLGGSFPDERRERRVQFPIEDEAAKFHRRCTAKNGFGWIADLRPRDWAVIDWYQPYKGTYRHVSGGRTFYALAQLRSLSDMDKHRLPVKVNVPPTHIAGADPALAMILNEYVRWSRQRYGGIRANFAEQDAPLFWARMPHLPESELDVDAYIVPQIALSDGLPVIKLADGLASVVANIVSEFDPRS